PHVTVWWSQGAQPAQLLATKEVVMATAWNGRIYDMQQEGVPVSIVWKGGQIGGDVWSIPKGAKNKELAMLFIAWATLPENNVRMTQYISYAPANMKSFELIPEKMRPYLPSAYINEQVTLNDVWWVANLDRVNQMWREWKRK
ncbi:unnamed protein product, partial [marine sediment metagenome]